MHRVPHLLPLTLALVGACQQSGTETATLRGAVGHRDFGPVEDGRVEGRVDSTETSLTGLSVELIELAIEPGSGTPTEVGTLGTVVPDAAGRFSFGEIPALQPWPPVSGAYSIRIHQDEAALVPYGAGTSFWVRQGAELDVSIPAVTRLKLPLWDVDDPAWDGYTDMTVTLDADLARGRLVYVNTQRGVGFYDPVSATVDVLHADDLFEGLLFQVDPYVLEAAEMTGVLMLDPDGWRTAVLIDHAVFSDETASELLNYDDAEVRAALEGTVTVLDLSTRAEFGPECAQPESPVYFELNTTSVETASRWFVGRPGVTAVFDLDEKSLLDVWCDEKTLAVHQSEGEFLVFVTQTGGLELTDDTGARLASIDLQAGRVWQVAPWPGTDRVAVLYTAVGEENEARFAVVDRQGTLLHNDVASKVLGYEEQWKDPAYDWGNCDNPQFEPPNLADVVRDGLAFDASGTLLSVGMGDTFEWRDDHFVPRPPNLCGMFAIPDECTGHHFIDVENGVSVVRTLDDDRLTCLIHLDGTDLSVPITLDAPVTQFGWPTPIPAAGLAVVPTEVGATLVHYGNPDAATAPAVRDLTDEVTLP